MTGPESGTYWALVEAAARTHPERVVLEDDFGRSLTTAALRDAASRTAAALAAEGVGPGTVVSWQLPTTLETMVVMVALTRLDAVQNPILPIWREHEAGFATAQIGTEVMIVPRAWRGFDHAGLARRLATRRAMKVVVLELESEPGVRAETRFGRRRTDIACAPVDGSQPPLDLLFVGHHRRAERGPAL